MPLDLQPLDDKLDVQPIESGLDLQPIEDGLDLQPIHERLPTAAKGDLYNAQLQAQPDESFLKRAARTVREGLSPLLGPTELERGRDSILDASGQPVYKPAGSKIDQEGLVPALSHPMVPIPRVPQQEGKIAQVGAGIANTALGFVEFAESPLGLMTVGAGALPGMAGKTMGRVAAGGYAADMAMKVPEAAEQFGESTVNGTLQQQVESGLGLATQVVLPGLLAGHAIKPVRRAAERTTEQVATDQVIKDAPKIGEDQINEFGGEQQVRTPAVKESLTTETRPPTGEVEVLRSPPVTNPDGVGKVAATPADIAGELQALVDVLENPVGSKEAAGIKSGRVESLTEPAKAPDSLHEDQSAAIPGREPDHNAPKRSDAPAGGSGTPADGASSTPEYHLQRAATAAAERAQLAANTPRTTAGLLNWAESPERTRVNYLKLLDQQREALAFARTLAEEKLKTVIDELPRLPDGAIDWKGAPPEKASLTFQLEQQRLDALAGQQAMANESHMVYPPVSDFLAKLDSLKVNTRGQMHAFGLIPEAWNLLIDLVKAGVKTGRAIHGAIDDAIAAVKRRYPDHPAWDEQGLRDNLRQYGAKVLAADNLAPGVQTQVAEYRYEPRSNETDRTTADRIIEERGIDQASAAYRDETSSMPGAVRSILGDRLVEQMAEQERLARSAGNRELSDELIEKQIEFIDHELRRSTEIAQSLQAMRRFGLMSAPAMVRHARRTIAQAGQSVVNGVRPAVDAVRRTLDQVNRVAIDATTKDPGVTHAAQQAVNETIKNSPELHHAIVVEVAGGLGESPTVMRTVREKIQAAFVRPVPVKVQELWQRYSGGAGKKLLNAVQSAIDGAAKGGRAEIDKFTSDLTAVLRDQMDAVLGAEPSGRAQAPRSFFQRLMNGLNNPEKFMEVWKGVREQLEREHGTDPRVQALLAQPMHVWSAKLVRGLVAEHLRDLDLSLGELVAGHYRLANDGKVLRDRIIERTGLDEAAATDLARAIDREVAEGVAKARNDLDNRIRAARGARQDRLIRAAKSGAVALDLLPAKEVDRVIAAQLKTMNQRLGDVVKRSQVEQDTVRRSLGARVVAEAGLKGPAADKLTAAFDARFRSLAGDAKRRALEQLGRTVTVPRKVRELYQKLIEASNLGAMDSAKMWELVREKLGLPTFTPELAREILRRANEIQKLPEGFQRQRAIFSLLDHIARHRGVPWHEMPMAFWYANVLSGPTTHLVNTVSNVLNLSANVGLQVMRRPLATAQILGSLARGFGKGGLEVVSTMRSGYVTGTRLNKFEESRPLELARLPGNWDYLLTPWRAVGRALGAEDLLFFKGAEEMKIALAARTIAKREGLRGAALTARVNDILGLTADRIAAAQAQAGREGLTGLDRRRRVAEIIEQTRPQELRENARDYALKVTFNNKPYGLLGHIAEAINYANRQTVVTRFVVPFTNIVSNVVNESLNYFLPTAGARAVWGAWKGRLDGKPITDREALYDQYAKAAVGTIALAGLATAAAQAMNESDPAFAISGEGPRTLDQIKQLKQTGWIPNSVKIGGRYYSFSNTPLAIPLAIMGNYFDALRYRELGETDVLNRVAYAFQQGGHVILQSSFLDSVSRLFELANRQTEKRAGTDLGAFVGRSASSFVIPNALRQIDRYFDTTVYDASTVEAGLVSQVPFVRRLGKPALNALGQPVQVLLTDRFTKGEMPDALWTAIARQQAWVPVVPREVIVSDQKRGEDYYRVLSPEERYDYVKESGEEIRDRLDPDRIMDLEPDQAREYVRRITDEVRTRVKERYR